MFEIFGWIGSMLFSFCALPQCIKTHKTKSTKDLSWWFLAMWFFGEVFTLLYVIIQNIQVGVYQYPLIANYILNFLLLVYLIVTKIKYDKEK